MYPGLSEADCRVAEFSYRELHAEAARQRQVALAVPIHVGMVGVMTTMRGNVGALVGQARQLFSVCACRTQRNAPLLPARSL
jgi:hypothetical protein